MRTFFLIILLVGIAGFGLFIFAALFTDNSLTVVDTVSDSVDTNQSGNAIVTPFDPSTESEKVELQTLYGQTLQTNNFKKQSGVWSAGANAYHLDSGVGYQVLFNDNNDSFAINISQRPVLETRDRAVEALAAGLNISVADLCLLNIYISTTFDFDPNYANKNLGVPGC